MSVQKTLQSQKNDNNNNNVSNGNLSGNDGPIDISNGHNSTRFVFLLILFVSDLMFIFIAL